MKNIELIKKKTRTTAIIINTSIAIVFLIMKKPEWVGAVALGALFSDLILSELIKTQLNIIKSKKHTVFLLGYIKRLMFYATPIVIAKIFDDRINIWVTITFLLSNQMIYIIYELVINIQKLKKNE